jgi:hypothetical protein
MRMRVILATWFSVMMVWMQAIAAVSPHDVQDPVACQCCQCAKGACCVPSAPTAPAPVSSPLAASRLVSEKERVAPPVTAEIFQPRPVTLATAIPTPVAPQLSQPMPVYQRHCVLLI